MPYNAKIFNWLFATGIFIALLQIWLPIYYLSCDGPCHLYNAKIVHDIWTNEHTSLWSRFYNLIYTPDPNSTTTFVLALLLFVAKGAVAEKIFLSSYILISAAGFYLLISHISSKKSYWPLTVFVFIFTTAFAKGFYNFSLGTAFFYWMVWGWLRYMDKPSKGNAALFFMLSFFTFFSHLLPFVFGVITCAALILSHTFAEDEKGNKQHKLKYFAQHSSTLAILLLPFLVLMFWFTDKHGGMQMRLSLHLYRLVELLEFKYIITLVRQEYVWALLTGMLFCALLLTTGIKALRHYTIGKYDGFVLSLIAVGLIYLLVPEDFLGRTIIITIRAQIFIYIIVCCVIASRLQEGVVKNIGGIMVAALFLILSGYRMACMHKANIALEGYLSATNYINDNAVVLALDFSPNGKDANGQQIATRNAIFHHAAQYMAATKPLVILDNYEANMGYFPIRWREGVNPYNYLSKRNGIEGIPPYAEIENYSKTTGVTIDNILLWCYDSSYNKNADFAVLHDEIMHNYHRVYSDQCGNTLLYERNK